jgi:predicted CoA-binding protein
MPELANACGYGIGGKLRREVGSAPGGSVNDIVALLDHPDTVVAVVGATDHPAKYGGIIYRDLRAKGVTVRAVNPYRDQVAGDPCWRSLADLPEPPGIVNIVVPPTRTLAVLAECRDLGLKTVWVQPGAADSAVYEYLNSEGFDYLADACIMVPTLTRSGRAG